MSFNFDKCNTLRFSRRRSKISFDYKLSGHVLQVLDKHKHLGVTLPSNVKWNAHIDKTVSKTSSMIGFLRRNLGNEKVCPHVEYCSSVWDLYTKRDIQKVEADRRLAARFITNDYGRENSVTNMLTSLELPSPQQRRLNNRLTIMHKIVHSKVDLSFEKHPEFDFRDQASQSTHSQSSINQDRLLSEDILPQRCQRLHGTPSHTQ